MSRIISTLVASLVMGAGVAARADDAFFYVPPGSLKITEGKLPMGHTESPWRWGERTERMEPYVVLDGAGEAVFLDNTLRIGRRQPRLSFVQDGQVQRNGLFISAPAGKDVTGRLFYPKSDWSGMVQVKFRVAAGAADPKARPWFYAAKAVHYSSLQSDRIPGSAWFRHQARQAREAVEREKPKPEQPARQPAPAADAPQRTTELSRTYDLFSGGRAVSENLQLDRALLATREETPSMDVAHMAGITVQEIDWGPLTKDLKPELDPLAALVPADQHAVFFASFNAAVALADEIERQGALVLHVAEPQSESARTFERYQRQLCLSLGGLSRLLGPHVARSMALTGSDPYFPTGTDVAVLFETPQPALLEALLLAQVNLAAAGSKGKPQQGEVEGAAYRGMRSADRQICSYVARLEGSVVVTNSLEQLRRLASVSRKQTPSIASLPEYTFFRNRYRRGESQEQALVLLSDATIRRWCGPRWRIAASRRTRAAAVMAEMQAAHLDRLVRGQGEPDTLPQGFDKIGGDLAMTEGGVRSSLYGTLDFLTPIVELPVQYATKSEVDAYGQWRERYQQNWRWAFDPIALRVGVGPDAISADLTVMPLIWGTSYRELISYSSGGSFGPNDADPHEALAQFVLALNTRSDAFQRQANSLRMFAPGMLANPLGWLGPWITVYADDHPFWKELATVPPEKHLAFLMEHHFQLPVALEAAVDSPMQLTAFLVAARGVIDQTAPGMTQWETLSYREQPYVKITVSPRARLEQGKSDMLTIYYAPAGDVLIVSLREDVLKRAIDRQMARRTAKVEGKQPPAASRPWLGSNAALRVDQLAIRMALGANEQSLQGAMQARAWGNLPILNEWKRRYPGQDPVALHQRYWQTRLVCPGGGRYVWNEAWQTMESTLYGHPGEPKSGPTVPPALAAFRQIDFGLTFENQGLRARLLQARGPSAPKPVKP